MTAPAAAHEIVVADIGGTHARFAIADLADGSVVLGPTTTLRTADHAGLAEAWTAFAATIGRPPPRAASLAVAAPLGEDVIGLTNSTWTIRPASLRDMLGLDACTLVNDFAAVGHAVATLGPGHFRHLRGPRAEPPADGVTSIVGPGTGLGVALLLRRRDGGRAILPSEGGHIGFAPLDALDDTMLAALRRRFGRVSTERIVSGPGLLAIHAALAGQAGQIVEPVDETALWARALDGGEPLAAAALERFCRNLGAVAGDIALAHGADAVVIAGGLGRRLAERLPRSGFADAFVAKGRFEARMARMPVRLLVHPEPGLHGAAIAFLREQRC